MADELFRLTVITYRVVRLGNSMRFTLVAGSLAKVLDYLAAENIFIEYMYAFAQGDTAHVVIRPSNVERCVEILNKFNCNVLTKNSL